MSTASWDGLAVKAIKSKPAGLFIPIVGRSLADAFDECFRHGINVQ